MHGVAGGDVSSQVAAHGALDTAVPQTPAGADTGFQVLGHTGGRAETGDGHVFSGQALVLGGLALSGQRGGVVADDQVNVRVVIQHGFADVHGLGGILLGIVGIMDGYPGGIGGLDVFFASYVPGVLVRNGGVGIVPHILDFAIHVHAAFLQGFNAHFNEHRSEHGSGALGNHQRTGVGRDVGVPGADIDAGSLCFLQFLIQRGRVNRRNADSVHALVDGLLDQVQLGGNGSIGRADVLHGEAPIGRVLLGTVVGCFKKAVTGYFRDESNGQAVHRALAIRERCGNAKDQAQGQHKRQNPFHDRFLL